MGLLRSVLKFLKQYILAELTILLTALLIVFWRDFWTDIPFQISDSANRLILGRSIVILFWAVYILLTMQALYLLQLQSLKRNRKSTNKKLLEQLKQQYEMFLQTEHNQDEDRHWANKTEPIFNYLPPELKKDFIFFKSRMLSATTSFGFHKQGREGILNVMERAIEYLKLELKIS